jgi:hypothetical protein
MTIDKQNFYSKKVSFPSKILHRRLYRFHHRFQHYKSLLSITSPEVLFWHMFCRSEKTPVLQSASKLRIRNSKTPLSMYFSNCSFASLNNFKLSTVQTIYFVRVRSCVARYDKIFKLIIRRWCGFTASGCKKV